MLPFPASIHSPRINARVVTDASAPPLLSKLIAFYIKQFAILRKSIEGCGGCNVQVDWREYISDIELISKRMGKTFFHKKGGWIRFDLSKKGIPFPSFKEERDM